MESEVVEMIDEVDVEVFGRRGGKDRHPPARKYIIRVDKQRYTVEVPSLSGRAILELAGKVPPGNYILTQRLHGGGAETINLDDEVDFRRPGVERFTTIPRENTDG